MDLVDFLQTLYTLPGPAACHTYPTPLFNTWEGIPAGSSQFDEREIRPGIIYIRN